MRTDGRDNEEPQAPYPLMLDLRGRRCVVVGGGRVAERKTAALLAAGADVTVVSPEVTTAIAAWERDGRLRTERRAYAAGDTRDALLVFAATDDAAVNERIGQEAAALGQLVNVADRPELCSFAVPAAMRRGKLTIAVSTSGASPSAAAAIARELDAAYGDEYAAYIDFLSELRELARARVADPQERRELLQAAAEADVLACIRRGTFAGVRQRLLDCAGEANGARRLAALAREAAAGASGSQD